MIQHLKTRLLERLRRLWELHPAVVWVVGATRTECLVTLTAAAKPSQQRLHLRELFADGRRYYVYPSQSGFKLTSDSRQFWGPRRRRTRVASSLNGTLTSGIALDKPVTFVHVQAAVSVPYLLSALIQPLLFALIVLSNPLWSWGLKLPIALAIMVLAFLGRRADAALQVNDMVYFVQKVLEDLPAGEIPALEQSQNDVITPFREQFDRFYRERTSE